MENVLDNPAWNALISGNKHLDKGTNEVKYFDGEVAPFIGFKENTAESFSQLYKLLPRNGPGCFISPVEIKIPGEWNVLQMIPCFQMIYNESAEQVITGAAIIPLTAKHVPQMLALTKLTNPGPFAERTIEFGHYQGIFEGDQLVAMAGQRLHIFDYAEISAVCTHPDHLGKGYARQLLLHHVQRIKAASGVPFLHVRCDNDRAIKVYESLGFATRKELYFYIMQKAD